MTWPAAAQLAAALIGVCAGAAGADGAAVLDCMRANIPQSLRTQTIELVAFDREGRERTLRGSVHAARHPRGANLMARVQYPHDLAGAAYLVRDAGPAPELFLYLPEVKRIKRLAPSAGIGKLWGTDFSYEDFRLILGAFGGSAATLAGAAKIEGRPADVLVLTPPAETGYDGITLEVDRQTCVALAAEFRVGERVRKRLQVSPASLRRTGSYWHAAEMTLSDLRQQTRTRLRLGGVVADPTLSARYFHPQHFHQAH